MAGTCPARARSSTNPYLASCRKWNEQVFGGSPINSPAWVAVSGPSSDSASSSASRTGCVIARIARGSLRSRRAGGCWGASTSASLARFLSLDILR